MNSVPASVRRIVFRLREITVQNIIDIDKIIQVSGNGIESVNHVIPIFFLQDTP